MRQLKLNIKIIISVYFLLFLCLENIFSQGTDLNLIRQNRFFIGISAGPSKSLIQNTGSSIISNLTSSKKNSFYGSIDVGYLFSKYIGVSTGLGYCSYATVLTLDTYTNSYDTTDLEIETYNRRISGTNIIENQKISFLNFPLLLNMQLPFTNSFGLFLNTGINFSIPISNKYSSSGKFTYSGYYPAYNVLFKDIPYEGFKSNAQSDENGELKLKSFIPEFTSSLGLYLCIQDKCNIGIGISYNKMLSDISGYPSTAGFNLSPKEDDNNSLMQGSNEVSASFIGLKISFRYYLK
jgi:hypothetical protein